MPTGFRYLLCLWTGALAGCQFDGLSGSHLIWADRNTVGQPAVLMESVRRDVYRREPPQHVVPDQELKRVHADSMLFGASLFSPERPPEQSFEELPPPMQGMDLRTPESMPSLQDFGAESAGRPNPAVSATSPPDTGLSLPAPASNPLDPPQSSPSATDPLEVRPPAPSLPQDVPRQQPVAPKRPAQSPNRISPDDELHQAAFRFPVNETRAGITVHNQGRAPAPRQPVGGWRFSN